MIEECFNHHTGFSNGLKMRQIFSSFRKPVNDREMNNKSRFYIVLSWDGKNVNAVSPAK